MVMRRGSLWLHATIDKIVGGGGRNVSTTLRLVFIRSYLCLRLSPCSHRQMVSSRWSSPWNDQTSINTSPTLLQGGWNALYIIQRIVGACRRTDRI